MGVIDTVKEKLNIGTCHDPEHHHPERVSNTSGTQTRTEGQGSMRGTETRTTGPQTTTTTTRGATTTIGHNPDCPGCEDKWHQQGKHVPWEDAQGKMGEAHEQARLAEVNACKATTALESVSEAQRVSEQSRSRLAELERELAGMRTSSVDLRAKQAEVDAAKRRAAESQEALIANQRRAKEHEGVIADKDRAAMAAQGKLKEHQRGIAPLEDELENVRRAKLEAEERYKHHHTAWQEFEGQHGPKEAELNRLQQEIEGHNRAVKEAEAALAAAQMRHRDAYGKYHNLRGDYDASVKHREQLRSHGMSAKKYLDDLNAHEAELLRKLEQRRGLLQQHQGVARTAVEEAEAECARHQEHLSAINPLKEKIGMHMGAAQDAEAGLGDAAQQQRAERERQAALARELEQHKRSTTTTTTNAQQKVQEYEAHKARADQANARKEELFDEAKHLGGIGDRNADSHLRQLENRIKDVDIAGLKNKGNTTSTTTTHTMRTEE